MKIKIFKTKITSHTFFFNYVSELYLNIIICVEIHCFQTLHIKLFDTNCRTYEITPSNVYFANGILENL